MWKGLWRKNPVAFHLVFSDSSLFKTLVIVPFVSILKLCDVYTVVVQIKLESDNFQALPYFLFYHILDQVYTPKSIQQPSREQKMNKEGQQQWSREGWRLEEACLRKVQKSSVGQTLQIRRLSITAPVLDAILPTRATASLLCNSGHGWGGR